MWLTLTVLIVLGFFAFAMLAFWYILKDSVIDSDG